MYSKFEIRLKKVKTLRGNFEISTPENAYSFAMDVIKMDEFAEERVYLLCLDVRNSVIGFSEIAKGTTIHAELSPREIYMAAMMCNACSVVLLHNHPSGKATPSKEDEKSTKKIRKAGEVLQIKLMDHIIIGDGEYYSFAESWNEEKQKKKNK